MFAVRYTDIFSHATAAFQLELSTRSGMLLVQRSISRARSITLYRVKLRQG